MRVGERKRCALLACAASSLLGCATLGGSGSAPLKLPGWDAAAVDRARTAAIARLERPKCRGLLTEFSDAQGRPLQATLDEFGGPITRYVELLPFLDGASQPLCRGRRFALLSYPGDSRIFVCQAFVDLQRQRPRMAENMLIHEVLHTLGLGENPPSSFEITHRVESRCR